MTEQAEKNVLLHQKNFFYLFILKTSEENLMHIIKIYYLKTSLCILCCMGFQVHLFKRFLDILFIFLWVAVLFVLGIHFSMK